MKNLPNSPEKPEGRRGGCLRKLIGGAVLLLLVLIGLHFLAPVIGRGVANRQLPEQLGTEASLDGLRLNLLTGNAGLRDLRIAQPEGFEGDPLMSLDALSVNVPVLKALAADPIVVERVHLRGLELNLINDTNQVMNVSKLGAEKPEETPETEEPGAPPPVWLKELLLEQVRITFRDNQVDWNLEMDDIHFELHDLRVEQPSSDGPATAEGRLAFHSPKADGLVKLHAKIGTIQPSKPERVPPLQMALGIVGFDLDLVAPFLKPSPAVAKKALGGNGFDLIVFMQINPGDSPDTQSIDGRFTLVTDAGQKLSGPVGGTLETPELPFMKVFTNILGNQFGRVTRLGGNVLEGGVEAGKTAVKTGGALVKGAADTAAGFAGGVLKTGKGLITLDKDEALAGMKDATVGTVGKAAGTVADTAGTAGKGVMDTTKVVFGGDEVEKWWKDVPARMENFEKEAEAWFGENPFPEG